MRIMRIGRANAIASQLDADKLTFRCPLWLVSGPSISYQANVRFGSLAATMDNISVMAAFALKRSFNSLSIY